MMRRWRFRAERPKSVPKRTFIFCVHVSHLRRSFVCSIRSNCPCYQNEEKMRPFRSFVTPLGFIVALSFCASWYARAETSQARNAGSSVGAIAPIFSQLVYFRVPANFVSSFEEGRGDRYIHEWVLSGESVSNWTQMLTLTGAQNFSLRHPEATPKAFARAIASGFQRACPTSFSTKGIYEC